MSFQLWLKNTLMKADQGYHIPVMYHQCIEALNIKKNGVYVDATFGGGGHSKGVVARLDEGHLYAFDQDRDAIRNLDNFGEKDRVTLVLANFRYLKRFLRTYGVDKVDGIIADLGVSSHQIDEKSRGFSTMKNAELNMRMNSESSLTARKIVNDYDEKKLIHIMSSYGEIRNSKTLVRAIVEERNVKDVETTEDLRMIVERYVNKKNKWKYLAQVFQAIRMEVNDELEALKDFLKVSGEILRSGGRLVVMSYHSLEDRLVKNYINKGNLEGEDRKDFYGNKISCMRSLTRKPIRPSTEEIQENKRARSAKLRIGEKI